MDQIRLMAITTNLQPGQCFRISGDEFMEAVRGELRSAFDLPVRQSDINDFIAKIERNWRIHVHHDPVEGHYTFSLADQ